MSKPVILFLDDVRKEVDRSRELHGNINSLHEAFGIIYEEFIKEFGDEVFKKKHDHTRMREELVQIAAMCAKTVEDCLTVD